MLAGCGYFGRADDETPIAPDDPNVVPVPTAAGPGPTGPPDSAAPGPDRGGPPVTSAGPDDGRAPVGPAPGAVPANAAATDHGPLRVRLVVADGLSHPHDGDVTFEVRLENRGREVAWYEAVQGTYVVLGTDEGDVRWRSTDCRFPPAESLGLHPLPPGESIRVVERYPAGPACRLEPGRWWAVGRFPVCPPERRVETENRGTYVCEEGGLQVLDSGPLALTLT